MEIEFLIIADAVEAANGKLYMIGGAWDRWTSHSYPSPMRLGIAIGLLVPWDETNQRHRISVSIVDADGKAVVPQIEAGVEVGRPPGMRLGSAQRAVLAINAGFPLPNPGRYEVRVAAPNEIEKKVTFDAVLAGQGTLQIQ
jgi:hypothetical protein